MMLPSILPEAYKRAAIVVAILLVVVALVAYGRGLGINEGRVELYKARAEWQAQATAAEAANRDKEQQTHADYEAAISKGIEREKALRTDLDAARAAAGGLRDTVTALRGSLSAASSEAARLTADAALAVFSECAARYGTVAELADRHANDAETCHDAWPH